MIMNYELCCNNQSITGMTHIETLLDMIKAIGCVIGQNWAVISLQTGEVLVEYGISEETGQLEVKVLDKDIHYDPARNAIHDARPLSEVICSDAFYR